MFNVRPDKGWFGFRAEQPKGFRLNANGSVHGGPPSDLSTALLGYDLNASAAMPGSAMFNVRPELHLPGLHHFKPPEEVVPGFRMNADGSTSEAPAPATQLYRHVGSKPLDFVDLADMKDGSAFDPGQIQPVNLPPRDGIPGAANDNRFHVCTEAAHACIQNTPPGATQMRGACMTAEEACNYTLGLTRNGPFPSTVIVSFPDGGRVIVPRGSMGGGQFIPAPQPSRPSGR